MPHFSRLVLPMIVPAVLILDRSRQQGLRCQVIEAGQIDRVERAHVCRFAAAKRLDTAGSAEKMCDCFATEAVFGQVIASCSHAQGACVNEGLPEAALCTGRAVAFARPLIKIDIRFEADCAAMTTAVKGLLHLVLHLLRCLLQRLHIGLETFQTFGPAAAV